MEGKNQFLLKAITKNKAVQYYPNFALFLLNFAFRKCGYHISQMRVSYFVNVGISISQKRELFIFPQVFLRLFHN